MVKSQECGPENVAPSIEALCQEQKAILHLVTARVIILDERGLVLSLVIAREQCDLRLKRACMD